MRETASPEESHAAEQGVVRLTLSSSLIWRTFSGASAMMAGSGEDGMTDSGPLGMSHFPRVHHRYRRGHGLRLWWLLALIAGAALLWLLPAWR